MKMKSVLSIILCLLILLSSLPIHVFAQNTRFISVVIQNIDSEGNITNDSDTLLTDGENLYASTHFLSAYTHYNYKPARNAFVRVGQKDNSSFGTVELNFDDKTATVHPVSVQKQTYNLDGLYKYGSDYYLPLHQMLAFLKATIEIEGNIIRITNSGYSLADAEYLMATTPDQMHLFNYGTTDIIDDVFNGDSKLYYAAAVLSYFSSAIFDFRLFKLNYITKLGDKEDYCSFLEKCATNNSVYIQTVTEQADVLSYAHGLLNTNKAVKDFASDMSKLTSLVSSLTNPLGNSFAPNEALFFDSKLLGNYASSAKKYTTIVDYALKLGTMSEDHAKMLENFKNENELTDDYALSIASKEISSRFNTNKVKGIFNEAFYYALDEAEDFIVKNVVKEVSFALLGEAVPVTAMVSGVALFFKAAFNFDLTDNTDYSIMLDSCAKSAMASIYYNNTSVKTVKSSEELRLSAILYLLSCVEFFNSADKLSTKYYDTETVYATEKEQINAILALYYLAAQSKNFDNFEGIEKILKTNKSIIDKSEIIKNAPTHSEVSPDAIVPLTTDKTNQNATDNQTQSSANTPSNNNVNTTRPQAELDANWQSAAFDLICRAPEFGLELSDTTMSVELIDATGDHIPEIFFGTYMGFYQIPTITGYFYYNGSKYVKGTMSEHQGTYPIEPHTNSSGQPILLTTTKGDNDFSSVMPDYSSYWYTGIFVYQLSCSGSTANFKEVANFSEYRNDLDGFYSEDANEIQWAQDRWDEFLQEAMNFNMNHPIEMYYNIVVCEPVSLDVCSAEGYKSAFTASFVQSLVDQYANYY